MITTELRVRYFARDMHVRKGKKKKARFDYDVLAQKSLLVALKFEMKLSHPWGLSVF